MIPLPVDQIERSTQLVVSNGFLGVVGGVIVLFLAGVLASVLWAGRSMVKQQESQHQALFAWQQEVVGRLLGRVLHGNGDPTVPGLRQIGERLDTLDRQQVELAESTVRNFRRGEERMQRIETGLGEVREVVGSVPCIRDGDPATCPQSGQ